ncbi:MAG: hypothetical protein ACD_73C00542G0001 [uncultured bacterium]|nr:MAG: hypothetical protein ACD_73C00542G0001 [uncultured bacterium]
MEHLTETAYLIALKHGLQTPFIDIELDLYNALRDVISQDMLVAQACGEVDGCQDYKRFNPWSDEAQLIFKE